MSVALTVEAVQAALKGLIDPNTQIDFVSAKSVKNLKVDGGDISLDVVLGYPAKSQFDAIRKSVIAVLRELPDVKNVSVNVSSQIVAHAVQRGVKLLPNVKNIIAVASGKGGVGKLSNPTLTTSNSDDIFYIRQKFDATLHGMRNNLTADIDANIFNIRQFAEHSNHGFADSVKLTFRWVTQNNIQTNIAAIHF